MRTAAGEGYTLDVCENKSEIFALADIIASIEKLRFMHPEGHFEFFKKELRWNNQQVESTRDGLDIETLELSFLNKTGLKLSSNEQVMQKLIDWNGGGGLKKISRDIIETSSAICLLRGEKAIVQNNLQAGMTLQRVWLAADSCKVSFHPISSPIFFFDRVEKLNDLPAHMSHEILNRKKDFEKIFHFIENFANVFLFRIAISGEPTAIALRKHIDDCLQYED
jgi:hypothetical protein